MFGAVKVMIKKFEMFGEAVPRKKEENHHKAISSSSSRW
jgi:hypothetical protein